MRWGRVYFAVQAAGGAAWWSTVFLSPFVREVTLGALNPLLVAVFDVPLFIIGSALAAFGVRWAAGVATAWTGLVAVALAVYATVTGEAGWGVLLMAAAVGGSIIAASLIFLGRVPTEWIASGPFRFRLADAGATSTRHVAVTLVQIVIFWGLCLAVIPLVLAFLEDRWMLAVTFPGGTSAVGIVMLVLASALGLWAAAVMSTTGAGTPLPADMPNRLVVAGPYRFVRNPMAVAGITQGVAVGLVLSSWIVVVYAISGSLLWNHVIRPLEEADLEARFGAEFRRYRDSVRCWWPRFGRRHPNPSAGGGFDTAAPSSRPTQPAG